MKNKMQAKIEVLKQKLKGSSLRAKTEKEASKSKLAKKNQALEASRKQITKLKESEAEVKQRFKQWRHRNRCDPLTQSFKKADSAKDKKKIAELLDHFVQHRDPSANETRETTTTQVKSDFARNLYIDRSYLDICVESNITNYKDPANDELFTQMMALGLRRVKKLPKKKAVPYSRR